MRTPRTSRIRRMFRQACSLALVGLALLTGCQRNEDRTLADELDRIIEQRQTFNDKKEERIGELKRMLDVTELAHAGVRYQRPPLRPVLEIQPRLGHPLRGSATCGLRGKYTTMRQPAPSLRLTQLYSFSGKSIEAKRILDTTRRACVSAAQLPLYYETFTRYFEHYAVISNQDKYRLLRDRYNDSLLRVLTPGSYRYKASSGSLLIAQNRTERGRGAAARPARRVGENTPQYAEVAYELGGLYTRTGDAPAGPQVLPAVGHCRRAERHQGECRLPYPRPAVLRRGRPGPPSRYTQAAIEDALFSNVQFRSAQVTKFYADINAAYQAKETQTKAELQHYLLLISVLSVVLILLFIYVYKQMQRLYRIQQGFRRPTPD